MELTILNEVAALYAEVTEADVERSARHLSPPREGEEVLGVVHSLEARRMWAAALLFEWRAANKLLEAKFRANDRPTADLLGEQANRFTALQSLCRDVFWAEAKETIGGKAWSSPEIGLREGWLLVSNSTSAAARQAIVGISDLRKILGRHLGLEGPEVE